MVVARSRAVWQEKALISKRFVESWGAWLITVPQSLCEKQVFE